MYPITHIMHRIKSIRLLVAMLALLSSFYTQAEEANAGDNIIYYAIEPDIVTNFPKKKSSRLGFLNVQVQLVFKEKFSENIETILPLIQDALVMFLGSQSEDDIKTIEGREKLRTDTLAIIKELVKTEAGSDMVEDLLFTKYMWQ